MRGVRMGELDAGSKSVLLQIYEQNLTWLTSKNNDYLFAVDDIAVLCDLSPAAAKVVLASLKAHGYIEVRVQDFTDTVYGLSSAGLLAAEELVVAALRGDAAYHAGRPATANGSGLGNVTINVHQMTIGSVNTAPDAMTHVEQKIGVDLEDVVSGIRELLVLAEHVEPEHRADALSASESLATAFKARNSDSSRLQEAARRVSAAVKVVGTATTFGAKASTILLNLHRLGLLHLHTS